MSRDSAKQPSYDSSGEFRVRRVLLEITEVFSVFEVIGGTNMVHCLVCPGKLGQGSLSMLQSHALKHASTTKHQLNIEHVKDSRGVNITLASSEPMDISPPPNFVSICIPDSITLPDIPDMSPYESDTEHGNVHPYTINFDELEQPHTSTDYFDDIVGMFERGESITHSLPKSGEELGIEVEDTDFNGLEDNIPWSKPEAEDVECGMFILIYIN